MAGHLRFLFWKSIGNQRIEAFWSQLRRSCADWWIQFFKGLVLNGVYNNTDFLQVECFKFAFFPVIQKELEISKISGTATVFESHSNLPMKVDLLVDRTYFTLLRKVPVSISLNLTMMTGVY